MKISEEGKIYEFEIQGMDCADCASHIQKAVSKLKGVTKADISFGTSKLIVETTAKV